VTAVTSVPGVDALEDVATALAAARRHLAGLQHPEGWWKAELETNVTMDAEDLMLRWFLGILDPQIATASAK
jgi:squalene-hopene/tetraprenyl-beta-curcumene cyclase